MWLQVDGDYDKNDEELELDILDEAFVDVKDTTLSSDDFDYLDSYSDEGLCPDHCGQQRRSRPSTWLRPSRAR